MIKEISMSKAEKKFSELVDRATDSGARFILKKGNKAVAAIINLEDFNLIKKKAILKKRAR